MTTNKDIEDIKSNLDTFENIFLQQKEQFLKWFLVKNKQLFYDMHNHLLIVFSNKSNLNGGGSSAFLDLLDEIHTLTGLKPEAGKTNGLMYICDFYSHLLTSWDHTTTVITTVSDPERKTEIELLSDDDDNHDVSCFSIFWKWVLWVFYGLKHNENTAVTTK